MKSEEAAMPSYVPDGSFKGPQLVCAPGSPIEAISRRCARIAASDATVLVLGETGTGKEVMARLVHQNSPRSAGPFVPVNCGAIPEALLESELFGHLKGAFTGAIANRRGRLALAEGGTLFLDEIGELPLSLQVKLLRVLQDRTYEPIGSAQPISANFRLVTATNRDLKAEVEAGRFRQDLYYRLLVCPVTLPPLRERRDDVVPLFFHFWKGRGEQRPIEPEALQLLVAYDWPGNVRELENMVERLSVCSEGATITLADMRANFGGATEAPPRAATVPPAQRRAMTAADSNHHSELWEPLEMPTEAHMIQLPIDLPAFIRDIEDRYITAALEQATGNRRAAADLLGLQRTTLVEKLRRRTQRQGDATSNPSELPLESTGS
jgi:sigma-54 dependent transcriptional regulator, flagellar regulatory protein